LNAPVRRLISRSPERSTPVQTMTTVTVSSKFQVVIPEDVRSRLKLQPGQKVIVIEKDGIVHMIPLKPVKETRGIARGITAQNVREELDRF
jgi:AbrB family looped-hinge helix DNA binding protein